MRVAISTEKDIRSSQFSKFQAYTIIDFGKDFELGRYTVSVPLKEPDMTAKILKKNEVNLVITGEMNESVLGILRNMKIQTIRGFEGDVDDAVRDYLNGEVKNPAV